MNISKTIKCDICGEVLTMICRNKENVVMDTTIYLKKNICR
jgi:hypothetical protein